MPIYEYSCKKCGDFEVTQRMIDDPLKKCPTCGTKVTKLISQSAFHLKGSGWYMTDYAKNGTKKSGGSGESSESSESKTSSDSKDAPSPSSSSETSPSSSTKESSASPKTSSSTTKESSTSA